MSLADCSHGRHCACPDRCGRLTAAAERESFAREELRLDRALLDRTHPGVVSGRTAALVRIGAALVLMTPFLLAPTGLFVMGLLAGAAAGAGRIAQRRVRMEDDARSLARELPRPGWAMAGSAATGAVWPGTVCAGGGAALDPLTALGALVVLYVPLTFAVRRGVRRRSPYVRAVAERVASAADTHRRAQEHLRAVSAEPAPGQGPVAGTGGAPKDTATASADGYRRRSFAGTVTTGGAWRRVLRGVPAPTRPSPRSAPPGG